jgi:hypothetical protein
MSRLIAFGDSFVVGDLDDFGPTDGNYNPKFPPTHGMTPGEREKYLKYNVSFVSIIAKELDRELAIMAVRGCSNYAQLDQLIFFISRGELKPDDIIMFGMTTTCRDRAMRHPCTDVAWDKFLVLDLVYILSTLDSMSKKYSVPIYKFNLFDNPLVGQPFSFNFDFYFDNYIGWDLKANTLTDILNDTWGHNISDRYPYHTHMTVKEEYEQFWTWNRHPSEEGHKKIARWFLKEVFNK